MAEWNHDMGKAPRGRYRLIPSGKGTGTPKVFEPQRIVVAGRCGTVTISYWIDADKRWNMFTAETPPIAWMEYAGPRQYVDAKGKTRSALDLPPHPTMQTSWFDDLMASRRAA